MKNMKNITIRKAKFFDFYPIIELSKQMYKFNFPKRFPPWFERKSDVKNKIDNGKIIVVLKGCPEKVIGYLSFEFFAGNDFVDIDTVIVDKKYIRSGIGRKLVKYFLNKTAKEIKKIKRVTTGSYKVFKDKEFYLKMGFKEIFPYDCKEGELDWYEFEKKLVKTGKIGYKNN